MRSQLKAGLLAAVSGVTGRSAVLLASQAASRNPILALRAPYRVHPPVLTLHLEEPGPGTLTLTFSAGGAQPGGRAANTRWSSGGLPYPGPTIVALDLRTGEVRFGGAVVGTVSNGAPVRHRRFSWHLSLDASSRVCSRTTGHYVPRAGQPVDASYYAGEDYADYEAESTADREPILNLAHAHGARGRVLEIGCATGGTLAALGEGGFDAYGLDFSAWAVERARERVGAGRVWQCDVAYDDLPHSIVERAPFGLFVLASVLEHFAHPFDVLERLGPLAGPDAVLIAITSNADSLTHRLFGSDWEGYFDWTHHGVDGITPTSLRRELPRLGWDVRALHTVQVWDGSEDPTHATVRDWYASDARFRQLLAERELGDFITCVAVRA